VVDGAGAGRAHLPCRMPVFPCWEINYRINPKPRNRKGPKDRAHCTDGTTPAPTTNESATTRASGPIGRPVPPDQVGWISTTTTAATGGRSSKRLESQTCKCKRPFAISAHGRQPPSVFGHPGGDLADVRLPPRDRSADGGNCYTIVPPSPHPDTGQPHLWRYAKEPVAELPAQVVDLLRPAPRPESASGDDPSSQP
jgi:hypothetical protein